MREVSWAVLLVFSACRVSRVGLLAMPPVSIGVVSMLRDLTILAVGAGEFGLWITVSALAGDRLDRAADTSPWLTLVAVVLGFGLAVYRLIRTLRWIGPPPPGS